MVISFPLSDVFRHILIYSFKWRKGIVTQHGQTLSAPSPKLFPPAVRLFSTFANYMSCHDAIGAKLELIDILQKSQMWLWKALFRKALSLVEHEWADQVLPVDPGLDHGRSPKACRSSVTCKGDGGRGGWPVVSHAAFSDVGIPDL